MNLDEFTRFHEVKQTLNDNDDNDLNNAKGQVACNKIKSVSERENGTASILSHISASN